MTNTLSLGLLGLAAALALSGCGKEEMIPAVTAEEGATCVKQATAAYGVDPAYVNLDQIGEDPTGDYTYAIPGAASRSAGQPIGFLCRFDDTRQFVDIVTYVRKK